MHMERKISISSGLYKDKTYKWGYFIEINNHNIDDLIELKNKNDVIKIIWVARFIKLKHPEYVVKLATSLKNQGYKFKIQMLGTGKLEEKIKKRIKKHHLENEIELVGSVPSNEVSGYMEKSDIFIGTMDKNEGWGVVVNEAMNAACAIVANKEVGSVPYLIGNNDRGFMYENYKDFEEKVKELIDNEELRRKFEKNAFNYITTKWTASLAAENLINLFKSIINNTELEVKEGPASKEVPM